MGRSLRAGSRIAANPEVFNQRGRAIVYEASPDEYFMAGIGANVRFLKRAEPECGAAAAFTPITWWSISGIAAQRPCFPQQHDCRCRNFSLFRNLQMSF